MMKSVKELSRILQDLLVLPAENECVEFKEAKHSYDFKDIGKYFSALSNEANLKGKPEAWMVFGINNKHVVTGTQFRSNRKDLDHLKYEIAEKVNNCKMRHKKHIVTLSWPRQWFI
jgi:ATP-dependent DNA helicase RecG